MQETAISWTQATWNPASGCRKITAGCKHCYAETLAEKYRGTNGWPVGFDPMMRPWKLDEPVKRLRSHGPSLIFLNSTSDLFLEEYLERGDDGRCYVDRVIDVVDATRDHRYQILTKRPHLAADYWEARGSVPPNVWMGTTIERDDVIDRADHLRRIDARVRFISAEPLLGPLTDLDLTGIHWVITGGESGLHMRDPEVAAKRGLAVQDGKTWKPRADRVEWIRDIDERCAAAGVAHWFKQWGGVRPESGGRILDGSTRDGMPTGEGAMPPTYVHAIKTHRADRVALPVVP